MLGSVFGEQVNDDEAQLLKQFRKMCGGSAAEDIFTNVDPSLIEERANYARTTGRPLANIHPELAYKYYRKD